MEEFIKNPVQPRIPMNIQSFIYSPVHTQLLSGAQVRSLKINYQFVKSLTSLAFKIISENLYSEYSYFLKTEKSCFTGSFKKIF
jgi:hypothetical protein